MRRPSYALLLAAAPLLIASAACHKDGSGGQGGSAAGGSGTTGTGTGAATGTGSGTGGAGAGTVYPSAPATTVPCVHDPASPGKDYEVGPGLTYQKLADVPFETLGPGDSVRVHYVDGGYHEKLLISTRGDEQWPILLCGIPDESTGTPRLPVIDAVNATSRPQLVFGPNSGVEQMGLISIYNNDAAVPGGKRPGYIKIANLVFQGARRGVPYTSTAGKPGAYMGGAAAINILSGDHLYLVGNVMADSENGLLVNSKDYTNAEGYDYLQTRDLWIQGNSFLENGRPDDYLVHHAYTEAIGIVFEYNYFGRLKDYAIGNAIADRSVGTVVRYNTIDGGGHLIALENAQTSWANVQTNVEKDPSLRNSYVYGNILIDRHQPAVDISSTDPSGKFNGYATRLVIFGGTDQRYESYRNGTLYFYNNTIVIRADMQKQYNTALFEVYSDPETPTISKVVARNNIFCNLPDTPSGGGPTNLFLSISANPNFGPGNVALGHFVFSANWINSGWQNTFPASEYYDPTPAVFETSGFITGAPGADPGFVALAKGELHLAAGSPAIDQGIALEPPALGNYDVLYEYVGPNQTKPRDLHGTPIDLGAFEAP